MLRIAQKYFCLTLLLGVVLPPLPLEAAPKKKPAADAASATSAASSTKTRSRTKTSRPASSSASSDQQEGMSPPALPADGSAPAVQAASVVVLDARTGGMLHAKNSDQRRPAASTQKLLTALIIAEAGNLDERIVVQKSDTEAEPTKLGFHAGEVYTRRELLTVLLVHSTNDGALALARDNAGSVAGFAAKMNRKARELGMSDSNFVNPNGLPAPGQYSTARDMARVAIAAYANPILRSIVCIKELPFRFADGHVTVYKNTNQVLRAWPPCNGMKTGYTNAAGHCLISSAAANGKEIISVALGDNRQIWRDSYALLLWGLTNNSRSLGSIR